MDSITPDPRRRLGLEANFDAINGDVMTRVCAALDKHGGAACQQETSFQGKFKPIFREWLAAEGVMDAQRVRDPVENLWCDEVGRRVAVYFHLKGKPMVMACDLYQTPYENIHSLGHAIEHLRGLERHGGGVMMERAFTGFAALPAPPSGRQWWETLGVDRNASRDSVLAAWKRLAMEHHPDRGGSPERMAEINAARDAALSEPVG